MRRTLPYRSPILLFLTSVLLCSSATLVVANDPDEGGDGLRGGLIAVYSNPGDMGFQVTARAAGIHLSLKADEAPHPQMGAADYSVRWSGKIKILRAAKYRFGAYLRGKFRLRIDGNEVLAVESEDKAAVVRQGPEVTLEAGTFPLAAEFTKLPGAARVQVYWEAPHFHAEPLPYDVLGHAAEQESDRLKADELMEKGRLLAEEHNCTACHRSREQDGFAKTFQNRQGPDLSNAGARLKAGWVVQWLEDPRKFQPRAVMPRLFDDSPEGKAQIYAAAHYLASLGGPLKLRPETRDTNELRKSAARGERTFTAVGCVVCHDARDVAAKGESNKVPLRNLGSKTTTHPLAQYLQNPLATDPSGRMPNLLLSGNEATDLARYLCQDVSSAPPSNTSGIDTLRAFKQLEPRAEEVAAFEKLPEERQWQSLGNRVVMEKRCNSCHTIAPGGKPFAQVTASKDFDEIRRPVAQAKGCLADEPNGEAPRFGFSREEKEALKVFLATAGGTKHSPAPAYEARLTLRRFRCLECHSRDGEGGLTPELTEALRQVARADNAEAVSPPPLTGVGPKLLTPWLRQVLTQAGRARPWMSLRMPQFGPANVGRLPEALAAADGEEPAEQVQNPPYEALHVEAGRHLVGKKGFGCIGCHDIAGVAASGTRGPDLALMRQRVRYDWYRRWLEQPQRVQPGTRMPTIFPDGHSLIDEVLGGSADAQARAVWTYLSLGMNLPLPEGLEPPKGVVLAVRNRPVLLRTFLPDVGPRGIAVGYPGNVSVAFDAATCRLAYAWSGNFLDASPTWNDRGGNPAKPLGSRFWDAPRTCAWGVSDSEEPPDYSARLRDPAFGAPTPEGKLYAGPMSVHFEGYRTEPDGSPVFRYRVDGGTAALHVEERTRPLRNSAAVGLSRRFDLRVPAGRTAWLLAGESSGRPQLLDAHGQPLTLDLKANRVDVSAEGHLLVLPQPGGGVVALAPAGRGCRWHLRLLEGTWRAILRLPTGDHTGPFSLDLRVWVPYRPEVQWWKSVLATRPEDGQPPLGGAP